MPLKGHGMMESVGLHGTCILLYPVILVLLNSRLVSVPLGASTLVARVMRCVVFFESGHWMMT